MAQLEEATSAGAVWPRCETPLWFLLGLSWRHLCSPGAPSMGLVGWLWAVTACAPPVPMQAGSSQVTAFKTQGPRHK